MRRLISIVFALAVLAPLPAAAEWAGPLTGIVDPQGNQVGGVFAPSGAVASLSVSGSSGNVALPAGTTVVVSNVGSAVAYVSLGVGNSTTASAANLPVAAGGSVQLSVGSNTYLAAITTTGTTALNLTGGAGSYSAAAPSGGGGASLPTSAPLIGSNSGGAGVSVTLDPSLAISGGTLTPAFGTSSDTFAQGNDSRIVGALQAVPAPTLSALGGIIAQTAQSGQFVSYVDTSGVQHFATPSGGGTGNTYTAAGTSCATATPLTTSTAVITSGTAGQGVAPISTVGAVTQITNAAAVAINVCPPSGASFPGLSAGAPMSLAANGGGTFSCATSTICVLN